VAQNIKKLQSNFPTVLTPKSGPNTNLGHNSIILMIEAQALYINTLIKNVLAASRLQKPISISPKSSVASAYNNEIQSRLSVSAFADPKCNSWYKNEAGLITNNWSDAVIPYQIRTSLISWDEFDVRGEGKELVLKEAKTSWKRVVEETQVSNTTILAGLAIGTGAVVAGTLFRKTLKTMLAH
jgi:hypothetical protein